uniref:Uncharacterized protein n=1 Tax=Rhizophora mucronata TaxID=61149 RepID=A0A2P2NKJ2_RHIMU
MIDRNYLSKRCTKPKKRNQYENHTAHEIWNIKKKQSSKDEIMVKVNVHSKYLQQHQYAKCSQSRRNCVFSKPQMPQAKTSLQEHKIMANASTGEMQEFNIDI